MLWSTKGEFSQAFTDFLAVFTCTDEITWGVCMCAWCVYIYNICFGGRNSTEGPEVKRVICNWNSWRCRWLVSGFSGSGLWSSDEHQSREPLSKGSGIGLVARLPSCHHSAAERGTVLRGKKIRVGITRKERLGKGDIIIITAEYCSLQSYIIWLSLEYRMYGKPLA